MSKVIAIIGPTAVGKTAFAFSLAEQLLKTEKYSGVDLISADSRQVYEDLEITSGTDLGAEWRAIEKHWQHQDLAIRLFGVSILQAEDEWSVTHFQELATSVINEAENTNRLVMIVGGTGLYLEHLTNPDPTLHIPPNVKLRKKAEKLSLEALQAWLEKQNPQKYQSLNHSDRSNPRRLIRAIEIGEKPRLKTSSAVSGVTIEVLTVGLQTEFEQIETNIKTRIAQRIQVGAIHEVEQLRYKAENQKLPIFSTTGVKPILTYLDQGLEIEQLEALWFRQERQYAKRQLTWWKKRSNVTWFDVTQPNWQVKARTLIESWLQA